jgi:hypothetical protein
MTNGFLWGKGRECVRTDRRVTPIQSIIAHLRLLMINQKFRGGVPTYFGTH